MVLWGPATNFARCARRVELTACSAFAEEGATELEIRRFFITARGVSFFDAKATQKDQAEEGGPGGGFMEKGEKL